MPQRFAKLLFGIRDVGAEPNANSIERLLRVMGMEIEPTRIGPVFGRVVYSFECPIPQKEESLNALRAALIGAGVEGLSETSFSRPDELDFARAELCSWDVAGGDRLIEGEQTRYGVEWNCDVCGGGATQQGQFVMSSSDVGCSKGRRVMSSYRGDLFVSGRIVDKLLARGVDPGNLREVTGPNSRGRPRRLDWWQVVAATCVPLAESSKGVTWAERCPNCHITIGVWEDVGLEIEYKKTAQTDLQAAYSEAWFFMGRRGKRTSGARPKWTFHAFRRLLIGRPLVQAFRDVAPDEFLWFPVPSAAPDRT